MPGGDLGETIAAAESRRLASADAVEVANDIAAGLEHAHRRGIIHRDLKPANIWLDSEGRARLGDFGLAIGSDRSRAGVERMVVGTAAYLPPEQAIGRRTDERADLYSLGALLYEMVSGQAPFQGDDPVSIISGHLSAEPVPPSRHAADVPPGLDALILALLEKSPDDRPASASEVRERLAEIARGEGGEEDADDPIRNPLDALAAGLFVGRDTEFEELRQLGERAVAGRGGTAMIEGEPGIGKTRLAEELITYARMRGAYVLAATCHEADATPAYWPFAQAIRTYVRDADPVGLAWQLGADGPELARLVPELRDLVPSIGDSPPLESPESRFRFYDGIANFLIGVSRSRPLMLVFDDMHWADASSIELLRFLAGRVSGNPMLLACGYREEEAASRADFQQTIAEMLEVPNSTRISLGGLTADAIGRYVQLSTGTTPSRELAARIHEQTGGNPFFVGEVVRLLASDSGGLDEAGLDGGGGSEIPRGVRDAVRRRIERLPDPAAAVLEAAAVIGRSFDRDLLTRVGELEDIEPSATEAALDAARAARITERSPRAAGELQFAHAVFRETLYDELAAERRQHLHTRAGVLLEEVCRDDPDRFLPALARHFLAAGPEHREQARDYAIRAARQAASRLAHADAAMYLEQALAVTPALPPEEELPLRLELADEMTRSGRFRDARPTILAAARIARELGDECRLAEAAIALGAISEAGSRDTELADLLDEALAAVGDDDLGLRASLLVALAQENYWDDPTGLATDNANEAVAIAREIGDDAALAPALAMKQFVDILRQQPMEERVASADELIEVARRARDATSEVRGYAYRLTNYLQAGDMENADRAFADFKALARKLAEPRHLWHIPLIEATWATLRGDFEAARRLSEQSAREGARAQEPLSAQYYTVQMARLHTLEGSPEEMLPAVRPMVERHPGIPAWRFALVGFLIDAGHLDEARIAYEPIAARSFDDFPRDANWVVGLARVADAAAVLGDLPACRELIKLLEPSSGDVVIVGRAAATFGPVDRYLGRLAAAIGDQDRALAWYESALATCQRMGDRPMRAETRAALGRLLLDRDAAGDREKAFEELSLALEEAQDMGMRKLVESCVRMRLEAQGVAGVDANASIDSVALAVSGERPDLGALASSDGRVTILFSDIENSTLMTERLGDARWIEILREHNTIFRTRLERHGGYEVKNQGDGFMLAFSDPAAALDCAVAVQRDFADREADSDDTIRVRMGMHVGEVIAEGGDFFGRSVILAARIAAQARGGEILISSALRDSCAEDSVAMDDGRELELKGLAGAHRVYSVDWEREAEAVG
jgi:class 3 adenylate cyclase